MPSVPISVLDRVKMFLPQIHDANLKLEEDIIKSGSNESVRIDADIIVSNTDCEDDKQKDAKAVDTVNEKEGEAEGDSDGDDNDFLDISEKDIIKLEFMLGNFDNSVIAQMEDLKDDADNNSDSD